MKKILFDIWVLTIMLLGVVSCQFDRPKGWYYLTNGATDSLSNKPIVTITDFETLRLDSSVNKKGEIIYQIVGTFNKEASTKWADATEKSIGKRIGFIYNNEVVCDPYVNCQINNGAFAISTNGEYNIKELYKKLTQ